MGIETDLAGHRQEGHVPHYSHGVREKAQQIIGQADAVKVEETVMRGLVKSTTGEVYRVTLALREEDGRFIPKYAKCSCEHGRYAPDAACSHAAALEALVTGSPLW